MNKIIFTPRERNWDNYVLRKKKSSWSGLTKFVTIGQCWRRSRKIRQKTVKTKKKSNDPLGFIVSHTLLAFFLGS